jgi:hypothetical protein
MDFCTTAVVMHVAGWRANGNGLYVWALTGVGLVEAVQKAKLAPDQCHTKPLSRVAYREERCPIPERGRPVVQDVGGHLSSSEIHD